MTPGMLIFFAAPVVGAVVALAFGIAWLSAPDSRAAVTARYPLPVVTWIIAAPMTLYAGAATFFGILFAVDLGATGYVDGFEPGPVQRLIDQFALPVLGLLSLVLGVLVIVMAHLRPRRGPWPRFAMLGVGAVPIALVLYGATAFMRLGDVLTVLLAAALALGSIANALLARPAQEARQALKAQRNARGAGASAATTTELPPSAAPPPPPSV